MSDDAVNALVQWMSLVMVSLTLDPNLPLEVKGELAKRFNSFCREAGIDIEAPPTGLEDLGRHEANCPICAQATKDDL